MEPGAAASGAEAGAPPEDFVQSVGRAMRVLEVVGRRPGQPVKTIARRCALNISTTYHLIRTLAYQGYLVRLPDGTYVIGDAVARRFHDLVASLERPPDTAAVLRQLTERVGLSAYLGLLRDDRVTVVEVAEGPGSPYLEDFEKGLDVSAHATALGKALLTTMTPRTRRTLLLRQGLAPVHVADTDRSEPAGGGAGRATSRGSRRGARRVPRGRRLRRCAGADPAYRGSRLGAGCRGPW